jgi:hypothetical protein
MPLSGYSHVFLHPKVDMNSNQQPTNQFQHSSDKQRSSKKEYTSQNNDEFSNLTTIRLAAMKQITKHGKLEILSSGKVLVDFSDDRLLFLMDTEAKKVDLFKRRSESIQNLESTKPDYSCFLEKIPSSIKKTVRYAAKFIDLVRSKTPKVSL